MIKKIDTDFELSKDDFLQAINILDQAIEKLQEAKGWNVNLLQKNKVVFADLSQSIQDKLSKKVDSIFIVPITTVFTDLTTFSGREEIDLETMVQASNVILALRAQFVSALAEETANYENT